MKTSSVAVAICTVLTGVLACNLPTGQNGGQPDLAATITAQALTLQARANTAAPPTETVTSAVEVSVTSVTNCRAGPSNAYDLIFEANPGQFFKVVGKNTPAGYWIIENPVGGTCWLSGQSAVLTGETGLLSEYAAPAAPTARFTNTPKPTKTPKPSRTPTLTSTPPGPNYPSNFVGTKTCTSTTVSNQPFWIEDITLTWQDNASNEEGYRIYRFTKEHPQPVLLQALAPNVTQFLYQISYNKATVLYEPYDHFLLEAFNQAGSAPQVGFPLDRCH